MVGDALAIYGQQHGPHVRDPERIAYAIEALLPFWGDRPVSAVKGATCRAYVEARSVGVGTARRELGTLRAALNWCSKEGILVTAPAITLPAAPPPRERWLTNSEVAALLRASRPWPHLARFILLGLYTGSRGGVIRGLQWHPNTEGGHVDLERGLIYRQPAMAERTKKRAPPAPIPRQLLAHLRRWAPTTRRWVVEWRGEPLTKAPKRTWGEARKAAGLGPDVTPHVLRHTAATWMMQRGAPIYEAAGLLGMTEATLRSVYGHHHPDFMRRAKEALER